MKKNIVIRILRLLLKVYSINHLLALAKDSAYGKGYCEAVKAAHRNMLLKKDVQMEKRFNVLSPEIVEIKLFAKRKGLNVEFI